VTEPSPKPLNRFEIWTSNHAAPIFGVIALLIVVGAAAVFFTYEKSGHAEDEVQILQPQVTRVSKAICDKQSLDHPGRAERCAERIRIGLVNCRHSQPCRAAYLALATFPSRPAETSQVTRGDGNPSRVDRATAQPSSPSPATSHGPSADTGGGDASQPPSNHGHQHPGPTTGPTEEATHEPPSAVSPSPAPAPSQGESPATSTETPETAPQPAPTSPKPSGTDVEVCVLEHTCVGVEIGLGGLLPKGSE
jgi:hypothetical protein